MSDDLVVVEQALSTQPLRKVEVSGLRMLHHHRFVDGGNRMPRVSVGSGIHEVLDRMLRPRLNNIRLRDRSENGDLLGPEADDGLRRNAHFTTEGVLVCDVSRYLGSREGERSQSKSPDGDSPDGDEEVIVRRGLVANGSEEGPLRETDLSEVRNGVVDRGCAMSGRNQSVINFGH